MLLVKEMAVVVGVKSKVQHNYRVTSWIHLFEYLKRPEPRPSFVLRFPPFCTYNFTALAKLIHSFPVWAAQLWVTNKSWINPRFITSNFSAFHTQRNVLQECSRLSHFKLFKAIILHPWKTFQADFMKHLPKRGFHK